MSNPYQYSTGEGEREGERGGRGDTGGKGKPVIGRAWVGAAERHLQWEEVGEGYLPDSL